MASRVLLFGACLALCACDSTPRPATSVSPIAQEQRGVITIDHVVQLTRQYHPEGGRTALGELPAIQIIGGSGVAVRLPYGLQHRHFGKSALVSLSGEYIQSLDDTYSITPSPDGVSVAYFTERGDLVLSKATEGGFGDMTIVFESADPYGDFVDRSYYVGSAIAWSPDNDRIAFLVRGDALKPGHGGSERSETTGTAIFVYNRLTRRHTRVAQSKGEIAEVVWIPHSNSILFSQRAIHRNAVADFNSDNYLFDIVRLNLDTGEKWTAAEAVSGFGGFIRLAPSPDGRQFALYTEPFPIPPSLLGFEPAIVDLNGGGVQPVSNRSFMPPYPGEAMRWSQDSKKLFYRCKKGALFSYLCITDVEQKSTEFVSIGQTADTVALDVDTDNDLLVTVSRDPYDIVRINRSRIDGSDQAILFQKPRFDVDRFALGEVRSFRWAADDGLELGGLLVLPLNYDPNHRFPLIVDVHGGPFGGVQLSGALGVSSPLEWQMWAAMGYAVFVADYRLSGAYGATEINVRRPVNRAKIDVNTGDILAGVDRAIEIGIADPDRLAIVGHSWGAGYTNWILTKTNRFKAAISKEGWADARPNRSRCLVQRGCLWALRASASSLDDVLTNESAIVNASRVTTPVLIFSARHGFGSPGTDTSQAFADAIISADGAARRIHFEDDYHVFRRPANIERTFEESVEWVDRHLK